MSRDQQVVAGCLAGVAVSLLLVGVVSGTFIRHVIQILPLALAIVAVVRQPARGADAALALCVFWALIVVLIWLFLLGISNIASGHYTVIERILTLLMALFSLVGASRCPRLGRSSAMMTRAAAFIRSGGLQLVAMRVSLLQPFARR